jgi:hypothetical protein
MVVLLALAALRIALAEPATPAPASDRVRVVFDTAEAEAVLSILRKEKAGGSAEAGDWDRLFGTEGYRRLVAREAAMKRPFSRGEFETFVQSPELIARTDELAATLERWKKVDVTAAAARALAYLPRDARIRATIFPLIKPKPNSFVFSEPDPAIFLALDPAVTPEKLSNTLSHELHHIGFSTACRREGPANGSHKSPQTAEALKWLSAFGEGFAMMAAAGGPGEHPHAASPLDERARWDRNMERADDDLRTLDVFFRDVLAGRLAGEAADERGFSFFGVQGPWYTVGYRMAVAIEKAFGPEELIRVFCDPRLLPDAYNRAADKLRLAGARWSRDLVDALSRSGARRAA